MNMVNNIILNFIWLNYYVNKIIIVVYILDYFYLWLMWEKCGISFCLIVLNLKIIVFKLINVFLFSFRDVCVKIF